MCKQNTVVKTAIDGYLFLTKQIRDLAGECSSSLIINFEQVIKPFLV